MRPLGSVSATRQHNNINSNVPFSVQLRKTPIILFVRIIGVYHLSLVIVLISSIKETSNEHFSSKTTNFCFSRIF